MTEVPCETERAEGKHTEPRAPAVPAAPQKRSLADRFSRFAHGVANAVGSPAAFIAALLIIIVWAFTGPFMHFSETWQLIINTGTTILTFLMVFLIQNTQNRDARAIHLKLDELIKGVKGARNKVIDLENCTDEELMQLEKEFHRLRSREAHAQKRHTDAREREPHAAENKADVEAREAHEAHEVASDPR
jgi:low affinity Fe/Cu permease